MLAALALVSLTACEVPYLAVQAKGQLGLLLSAQPVSEIIRSQDNEALGWRWALAWSAREYARTEMGLAVTDQYTRGIDLQRGAAAHVVSAAGAFDVEPYQWWYPIVGSVPYKGFFDEADANAEAERMRDEGYDVLVRPVATYSLLGFLPDPLLSSMIEGSPERIVEVVIHELAHATVYRAGESEFNEGLATFIGRQGRQAFIADKLGAASPALDQALQRDADADTYREAVMALAQDLASYYNRPNPSVAGKQRIYRRHQQLYEERASRMQTAAYRAAVLPTNNAEVATLKVYSFNKDLYARAFAVVGGDWKRFVGLLRDVADLEQPQLALEQVVRERLARRSGSLRVGR